MVYTPEIYQEESSVTIPQNLAQKLPPEPEVQAELETETTEDPDTLESEIAAADEEINDELSDQSSDTESESAPHRSKAAEKRIKRLVAERNQLLQMLQSQQQLALRQSGQTQSVPQPEPQQVVDPNAPNPANYTNDVDYLVDVKFYQREQKVKLEQFQAKQAEMLKLHPEIPELVEESNAKLAQGIRTNSPAIEQLIDESEQPVELWYYLLSHQDEAAQIATLSPLKAAKAVAKIEAQLQPQTQPTTTKRQLPPPINPVRVSKATSKTSSIEAY